MDPQSQSFTPVGNQAEAAQYQQVLFEHSERISRLERQNNEDARIKSLWGHNSAFPSILSGTPQQAPQQYPSSEHLRSYDDDPNVNGMMSSLHLDAEDEPRSRALGATSRANSVRFDETANQNHFSSHSARPSMDLNSRQSSGYSSGLQMNERTPSQKSEGRASSAHSLRSVASGRASSLNLDYNPGEHSPPLETTVLAPGLLLLGPQPAIVRCWLTRQFNHVNVRYAAVSTGSYRSWIDSRLVDEFGLGQAIRSNEQGPRTMMTRLFFSEAVQSPPLSSHSGYSRGTISSQLPSLELKFCVLERANAATDSKAIQIVIGSDVLQPQRADVMFSTNKMTIYDTEGSKLSIPLVRPEDEEVFSTLGESCCPTPSGCGSTTEAEALPSYKERGSLNGLGREGSTISSPAATSASESHTLGSTDIGGSNVAIAGRYRTPGSLAAESGSLEPTKVGASNSDVEARPVSRQSAASRPSLSQLNTRQDETSPQPSSQAASATPGSASGVWTSWRREAQSSTPSASASMMTPDWAGASKARETSYTRKEAGIKVLKPKAASRTFSSTMGTPTTPVGTSSPSSESKSSRFFDRQCRISDDSDRTKPTTKENQGLSGGKPSQANPIGGGSAFVWLGK